jgi:hypothetical protein
MADLLQHTVLNQCIQVLGTGLLQGLPNHLSLCNIRIREIPAGIAFLLCLDPAQVAQRVMLAITVCFGIAGTKFHSDDLVIERRDWLLYADHALAHWLTGAESPPAVQWLPMAA